MQFYKLKSIQPLNNYKLKAVFLNGDERIYDVSIFFNRDKWKMFNALQHTEGLFERVKVDAGGYGISWNDELDLSCNELWYNGERPQSLIGM